MIMEMYETGSGFQIYRLPLTAFPGMEVNIYVVLAGEYAVLIDTGSGFGAANDQIREGFLEISKQTGQTFNFESLTHVLITHAHIDHFGGIPFIEKHAAPKLGVYILDKRILANYEDSLAFASRKLDCFFTEAGLDDQQRGQLMDLYRINKSLFHSVGVDFTYESIGMRLGPFEMLHVPGHTAGHVLIRVDGCVFTGDHILEDISPHQAPEQITPSTGLGHYLHSLDRSLDWLDGSEKIFPGHKLPITNAAAVIQRIKDVHRRRLQHVLDICREPKTILEISKELFDKVNGYHVLLALEEAGAHVEYLHQRGLLAIHNLSEWESSRTPIPLCYQLIESNYKWDSNLIL
jgi:glyoxylase-like metal-dependent hydrolase (beta-lactamase superfamily II)